VKKGLHSGGGASKDSGKLRTERDGRAGKDSTLEVDCWKSQRGGSSRRQGEGLWGGGSMEPRGGGNWGKRQGGVGEKGYFQGRVTRGEKRIREKKANPGNQGKGF